MTEKLRSLHEPICMSVGRMRSMLLGNQGEKNAQLIEVDVSSWLEKWPDATIEMILCRPGDDVSYPVVGEVVDGKFRFYPNETDTEKEGCDGSVFLMAKVGEECVGVSDTVPAIVLKRGNGQTVGEVPPPGADWVTSAMNAAERAERASAHPPIIGESGNWMLWDAESSDYIDSGVKAQGERGEQGIQGVQGIPGEKGEPGKDAEVDATLSVSGAAADAAVTGTKFNALMSVNTDLVKRINGKQDKGDYALRSELYAPILPYAGTLSVNTVYTADLSGNIAFALPEVADIAHENRIRMLARIAADAVIDWGTVTYYGAAKPFINEGVYEILWDYNPLIGAWVVGVTRIGQVSAE